MAAMTGALGCKDTGSSGRTGRGNEEGGDHHLYVKEQLECLESCLGMDEELTKLVCRLSL